MLENSTIKINSISVVGGGSWGTAISNILGIKGYKINLWVYEREVYNAINDRHENTLYLPGNRLSKNITPFLNIKDAVSNQKIIILVVPSHVVRHIINEVKPFLEEGTILVSASKGIENDTLLTMSQVIKSVISQSHHAHIAVLSGPTFAKELIKKKPSAATVASNSDKINSILHSIFSTDYLKIFINNDILGVELGGALKNVLAIASGISDSLGLGYNARAALITRGLAEMIRLGEAMGANPKTFSGLSGVGDLVLTCTGDLSRNRTLGKRLAKGEKIEDILNDMKMIAEGVKTVKSAYQLSQKYNVKLAIISEVYNIIYNNKKIKDAFIDLMKRETNYENV